MRQRQAQDKPHLSPSRVCCDSSPLPQLPCVSAVRVGSVGCICARCRFFPFFHRSAGSRRRRRKKCSNLDPHFKSECVSVFKFRSKFGPQLGAAWRHQKCGGSFDDSTVVFCRCITNLRLSRASKYFCIPCSFRFPALIRGVFELVSS